SCAILTHLELGLSCSFKSRQVRRGELQRVLICRQCQRQISHSCRSHPTQRPYPEIAWSPCQRSLAQTQCLREIAAAYRAGNRTNFILLQLSLCNTEGHPRQEKTKRKRTTKMYLWNPKSNDGRRFHSGLLISNRVLTINAPMSIQGAIDSVS